MENEELDDLIKKVERNKRIFQKSESTLLKVLKTSYPEIESITVEEKGVHYGVPHPGYSAKVPNLEIVMKEGVKQWDASIIGRRVMKQIKDMIGIDMSEYGSALDISIYIIEKKKIW
jgi:hypothetical protein